MSAPYTGLEKVTDFILDGTHGSPERTDIGIPVLSAQNVVDGRLNYETNRFTSIGEYKAFSKRVSVRSGDVLLTIVGTIGRAAVVETVEPLVFQRSVAIIRPTAGILDSRYLFHMTQSPEFIEQARKLTKQSTQAGIYLGSLKKIEIPLPSLDEQKRISAILDKANALRAKRRQAIALFGRLTQSIFLEIFGDPVSNPKGWKWSKLGASGTLDRGVSKHRPRNDPRLLNGRYPLIQTGDVSNSGGYIRTFKSTYSDLGLSQSKMWPAGTLCITIAANIASTGILTFPACFPDSVVGFKSPKSGMSQYVRVWMSFLKHNLERIAPAVAQKNINLAILRDLDIPLPSDEALQRFNFAIERLSYQEERLKLSQRYSDSLFASLQHRAFNGQL